MFFFQSKTFNGIFTTQYRNEQFELFHYVYENLTGYYSTVYDHYNSR